MGAVQDRHILIWRAALMELFHLGHDPFCFCFLGLCKMANDRSTAGQGWNQVFLDTIAIFINQGVGCRQDLRCGAVVLHHHDGLHIGEGLVEIQQILHIGSTPSVDCLVRITHDEQVLMIPAQDLHQLILKLVDVLELIDHDILQPLLPLEAYGRILIKDVKGEFDQVVIVQAKALLLLIEIPIEDDVGGARSLIVFLLQGVQGHGDHVPIVLRFLEQLADLDHIAGRRECHVPEAQAALFIDDLEHGINV